MIKPKKSLGQNFLKSQAALHSIISAGNISSDDLILEIGPGKGVLTEKILEKLESSGKVIAVEKDDRLIEFLQEKFQREITNKKLGLIHADILELDIAQILKNNFGNKKYKLIANIPYYITGALIRKFLSGDFQPERMVLLLQKEVAKRIVAQDKKESLLSLSVKVYSEPKYIETVKAKYFSPAPKVDSAILLIQNISKEFFAKNLKENSQDNKILEEEFFELLKAGFAHKRKVLIGNIKEFAREKNISQEKLQDIFNSLGLSEKVRAEDVSLEEWERLAQELFR